MPVERRQSVPGVGGCRVFQATMRTMVVRIDDEAHHKFHNAVRGMNHVLVRRVRLFQRSSILHRQASRAGARPAVRHRDQWHRLDVPRLFLRDRAFLVFGRCRASPTQGRQTYSNGR